MEEHYQAYFAWKRHGFSERWCWHVDAHLDIGKTGLTKDRLMALRECTTSDEAKTAGLLGNSYLPWGGLHCGNYLLPAITEGIVSRLSWVIPPDLVEGGTLLTWARQHLNGWFDLELSEYASLKLEGEKIVGTLVGIPFELGTLENLTLPTEPVLLDIDIDYFVTDEGKVWSDPQLFKEAIDSIPVEFQTVAYSVMGGFTPTEERRLALPFGVADVAGYKASPLDDLASLVRQHRYSEALELSDELPASTECHFLCGTSLQGSERYNEALTLWEDLLESQPDLGVDGTGYLYSLCSELCHQLGENQRALDYASKGQQTDRGAYRHHWNEAVAREALGDLRRAIKALRQTVRLSEHLLFGLQARYALSRLYRQQGKDGLARLELQKLSQLDVTGYYRPATMLSV